MMRAIFAETFGPTASLHIVDVEEPLVDEGHVLVDVAAAALGFVDSLTVAGRYQTKYPLPFISGMEFSGTVAAFAADLGKLRPGDRVYGQIPRGGLAQRIAVPEHGVSQLPDGVSFEEGAAVPVNYLTALYALQEKVLIKRGEFLLILGAAGGTGTAAIKIGKMLGAQVVAAASTEQKRAFLRLRKAPIWRSITVGPSGAKV